MEASTIIQVALAAFSAIILGLMTAISFILKVIWDGLREAQKTDIHQYKEIAALQLYVSNNFVKQEALKEELVPIKDKLDRIFEMLWASPSVGVNRRHQQEDSNKT